jgi:RHS repeat-associated protein
VAALGLVAWLVGAGLAGAQALAKSVPANGATGQATSLVARWTTPYSGAGYQVCWDTTNNNACDTGWQPAGGALLKEVPNLVAGLTYYWQVRALEVPGAPVAADGGGWWSFTVAGTAPVLTKTTPGVGASGVGLPLTVHWNSTWANAAYWVCLDATLNAACDTGWQPAGGAQLKELVGVFPGITYEWQVRADTTQAGSVYADGGQWRQLTTAGAAPTLLKASPAAGATGQATTVVVAWTSGWTGATYAVCADATVNGTCDGTWQSAGSGTSTTLTALSEGLTYEWQVRADTAAGPVYGDAGGWRTFTVAGTAPAVLKTTPPPNATDQATPVTLVWTSAWAGATYTVCVDAVLNAQCDTAWVSAGSTLSTTRSDLVPGLTYEWQVKATLGTATQEANSKAWRRFTVAGTAPTFTKSAPASGSTTPAGPVTTTWTSTWSGVSYQVCVDAAPLNGVCNSGWQPVVGTAPEVIWSTLLPGTAHEWQVRAVTSDGPVEADGGAWQRFTTRQTYTVTLEVPSGGGSGTVTASNGSATATFTGVGSVAGVFANATPVQLTAVAASDSTFVGWTGGAGCAVAVLSLTADVTCRAVFALRPSGGTGTTGGDEPPAVTGVQPSGPVHYYHLDALGSVRAVTNDGGGLVRRHDYLPFGEEWPQPAGASSTRFTGKEYDAASGLYYFGARYLRPDAGRFTTVDPVYTWTENLVDPQRWNRYSYVRNNPLKYTDPDGRQVDAVYDRKKGTLTITDSDTKKTVVIRVESGGKPFGGAIPAGSWEVLERKGKADFFRLDKVDRHLRDDKDEATGRGQFRLHKPGLTIGCIAARDWGEWKEARALIEGTKTTVVQDNAVPWWHLRSETVVKYGTLTVR